jgi:hypothetical protein
MCFYDWTCDRLRKDGAARRAAPRHPCPHFGSANSQSEPPAGTALRRSSPENSE